MKKLFITLGFLTMSLTSNAYSIMHKSDTTIVYMDTEFESLKTELKNILSENLQNTNKLIIKYNNQWKYVFPSVESIIMAEIMSDNEKSQTKVVQELIKNKVIIKIR